MFLHETDNEEKYSAAARIPKHIREYERQRWAMVPVDTEDHKVTDTEDPPYGIMEVPAFGLDTLRGGGKNSDARRADPAESHSFPREWLLNKEQKAARDRLERLACGTGAPSLLDTPETDPECSWVRDLLDSRVSKVRYWRSVPGGGYYYHG